jgi:hypothetical protein
MRITILRRLEALEEKYRSYEQKEWSSLRTARMYIWMIVLAYYLGDLRPEDDDPHSAYNRALKFPPDHSLFDAPIQEAASEYCNRLIDAYCRFFAARGLDLDEAPVSALFNAFVISVDQLPDQWSSWLKSNLQSFCRNVMIAPGSNLPRQISSDNFLIEV